MDFDLGKVMFKRIFFAGTALALISTSGFAADLPARTYTKAPVMTPPVYNWTGFYIGGHAGGGWGESQSTELDPGTNAFPTGTVFDKAHISGFLGGVQGGYNWQTSNHIVLGIEGEWSWADVSGTETTTSTVPRLAGFTSTTTIKANDYATAAGRLGFAADNWLLFVKGGAAWENSGSTGTQLLANGTLSSTSVVADDWHDGWVVGLGAEWGFARNWSAKIEYDHLDFGSYNIQPVTSTGTSSNVRSSSSVEVVKGGVNYHFN